MDEIGTLPTAIKGRFSEMRDMDDRAANFMVDADKAVAETLRKAASKGPNADALKRSYQEVISLQGKAMDQASQKVETAEKAFNVVDEVIRTLDDKLREFEAQLRKDGRWPTNDKPPRNSSAAGTGAGASGTGAGASASGSITQNNNNNGGGTTAASAGSTTAQKSRRSTSGGRNSDGTSTGRNGATHSNNNAHNSNNNNSNSNVNNMNKLQKLEEAIQETITTGAEAVESNEPKYCFCQQVSFGEMVGCDNESCPYQWFHYVCVGLTEAPPEGEKWLCTDCRKLPEDEEE